MSDEQQQNDYSDQHQPKQLETFPQQPLYCLNTQLPTELCNIIHRYMSKLPTDEGETYGSNNEGLRDTIVQWSDTNDWVGPFIYNYVKQANNHLFNYDIDGVYFNDVHMLTYNKDQWYGWHTDTNEMVSIAHAPPSHGSYLELPTTEYVRKLTFTLQLSDEDSYEGGDLLLALNDDLLDPITIPRTKGQMVIFDTRVKHMVKPVTKGTRHTLVGWAVGPRWK